MLLFNSFQRYYSSRCVGKKMASRKNETGFLVLRSVGSCVGQNQMCHFARLAFLVNVCRFARSFYNDAQHDNKRTPQIHHTKVKKYYNTENIPKNIFQIALNQNLMNHQVKTFTPEIIQNAHFTYPSFLSSRMISSPTASVIERFMPCLSS